MAMRGLLVLALLAVASSAPTWTNQLAQLKMTQLADISNGVTAVANSCGAYLNAYTTNLLFDGATPTTGTWGWNPTGCTRYNNDWWVKINLGTLYALTGVTVFSLGDTTHDPTRFTLKGCSSAVATTSDCADSIASCTRTSGTTAGQSCTLSGDWQYVLFTVTNTATGWQPYMREITFAGDAVTISPTSMAPVTAAPVWDASGSGYTQVACGGRCHPIQWPYQMGQCYDMASAATDCALATNNMNGIAFSLQDCYDQPNAGKMYCFMYKNENASPSTCQNNVFTQTSCTYATADGTFFIKDVHYSERFSSSNSVTSPPTTHAPNAHLGTISRCHCQGCWGHYRDQEHDHDRAVKADKCAEYCASEAQCKFALHDSAKEKCFLYDEVPSGGYAQTGTAEFTCFDKAAFERSAAAA